MGEARHVERIVQPRAGQVPEVEELGWRVQPEQRRRVQEHTRGVDPTPSRLRVPVSREPDGADHSIRQRIGVVPGEVREPVDVPDPQIVGPVSQQRRRPRVLAGTLPLAAEPGQKRPVRRVGANRGTDPIGHVDAPAVVRVHRRDIAEQVLRIALDLADHGCDAGNDRIVPPPSPSVVAHLDDPAAVGGHAAGPCVVRGRVGRRTGAGRHGCEGRQAGGSQASATPRVAHGLFNPCMTTRSTSVSSVTAPSREGRSAGGDRRGALHAGVPHRSPAAIAPREGVGPIGPGA